MRLEAEEFAKAEAIRNVAAHIKFAEDLEKAEAIRNVEERDRATYREGGYQEKPKARKANTRRVLVNTCSCPDSEAEARTEATSGSRQQQKAAKGQLEQNREGMDDYAAISRGTTSCTI